MPTIQSPKMPAGTQFPASPSVKSGSPTVSGVPLKQNLVDRTAKFIQMGSNPK